MGTLRLSNDLASDWVPFSVGRFFYFFPMSLGMSLYMSFPWEELQFFFTPFVGLNSNSESVFSVYVCEAFLISASPYLLCLLLRQSPGDLKFQLYFLLYTSDSIFGSIDVYLIFEDCYA